MNRRHPGPAAVWRRLAQTDAALPAEWEAKLATGTLPVMPGQPQVVPAAP